MTSLRSAFTNIRSSVLAGRKRRHAGRHQRLAIERLEDRSMLAAGNIDVSFGPNGTGKASYDPVIVANIATSVAMQPDGKIVVPWLNSDTFVGVARFDANGLPDCTFGTFECGFARVTGPGTTAQVLGLSRDVAIQSDGKIVVVANGDLLMNNQNIAEGLLVARFNANGVLDPTFGNSALPGFSVIPFSGLGTTASGIAIQSDGKIVVSGYVTEFDGDPTDVDEQKIVVARLLTNGELDSDFDADGKVITDFHALGYETVQGLDVAIQSDGRIIVVGGALDCSFGACLEAAGLKRAFTVARYNIDGSLDGTFGSNGRVATEEHDVARSVVIQPDGKILVAGSAGLDAGNEDFGLARYNPNGSLDPTFAFFSGLVHTDFAQSSGNSVDRAESVILGAGGEIYVAGTTDHGGSGQNFALARYNTNGALDPSFSADGLVTTDFNGADDIVFGVARQFGKIIAVGKAGSALALARYEAQTSIGSFILQTFGPTVTMIGTAGDDTIVVTDKGNGEVEFSTPDGRERVTVTGITVASIQANDGNDTLIIRQELSTRTPPPSEPSTNIDYKYDGGRGDNKVIVQGGGGPERVRITGVDVPDAREPDPHISLHNLATGLLTHLSAVNVGVLSASLGDGNDIFDLQWDEEQFVGLHTVRVDGGKGNDQISVQVAASAMPLARVEVNAGAGDDTVQVDLATTNVLQVQVTLRGEAGNDHLSLLARVGFNPQPDPPLTAQVITAVDGGAGNDVLSHVMSLVSFDGQDGIPPTPWSPSVSMTLAGGDGNDEVLAQVDEAYIAPASKFAVKVSLGNGTNVADLRLQGLTVDGTLSASVLGGGGADEVGIVIIGSHVSRGGAMSLMNDLGSGRNSANVHAEGITLDGGRFTSSTRGGVGADEVGIVIIGSHVGPDATMTWDTNLGNGPNVLSYHAEGLLMDGKFFLRTHGGAGADQVGIIVIGNHVGRNATMSWDTNLGNGPNGLTLHAEELVVDGRFMATTRGGAGADEVGIVVPCSHVGLTGAMTFNTYLGNGINTALVHLEELIVDGVATLNTQGGTGADSVMGIGIDTHVSKGASLRMTTDLGNGSNRYGLLSDGMVVDGAFNATVRGGIHSDDITAQFLGGAVGAGATLNVRITGGAGINTLRAEAVDLILQGDLRLNLTGGQHKDVISAIARLAPVSTGAVFGTVRGGAGNDDLTLDVLGSELAQILNSIVDGGLGKDTCHAHSKVKVFNCES